MPNKSFKQKVLKSIETLPPDASFDAIILKIYLVHNAETGSIQRESEKFINCESLIKNLARN